MPHRPRTFLATLAVAALLAIPTAEAAAQLCVGVPGSSGQTALRGSIGFPPNGNQFGAQAHHHLSGSPLTVSGTFIHQTDASINWFGVGAAWDLSGAVEAFPEELGFCAVADVRYASGDGFSQVDIPAGVAFGGALPVGDVTLMPFAAPVIYHSRFSNGASISNTDLELTLGATAAFAAFHVGVDIQNLLRTGSSLLTVRGGIVF